MAPYLYYRKYLKVVFNREKRLLILKIKLINILKIIKKDLYKVIK